MSLMKSLAKVAAGVMLAKGIGSAMKNQQSRGTHGSSGGLLGDLFGNNMPQAGHARTSSGGMGGRLGEVMGGRSGSSGGLGGLIEQFKSRGGSRGGVAAGGAAAGIGAMLGDLLGGRQQTQQRADFQIVDKDSQPSNNASFGDLFNESLASGQEPTTAPTPEQNAVAGLMLKAMIQAAKSDGVIDEDEKSKLMAEFGDLDEDEKQFIRDQMAAPVDPEALAAEVPDGYGAQVYLMSLMAIEFDNRKEAEYLHKLALGLGLDKADVNEIHEKVGVINLYA